MIPFDAIRDAALAHVDRLLPEWFPAGRRQGREFEVGNLHGDPGKSLKINMATGRWKDFAGNDAGGDLIDLRAAVAHRGDRTAAAKELAGLLGIVTNGHDKTTHTAAGSGRRGDDWHPIIPPPPDAGRPAEAMLARYDRVHEYTDLNDRVTHYVGRIEARGEKRKLFIPVTFGVLDGVRKWHEQAPDDPLPLYGLNRLAAMLGASVILCEGEKSADAAQAMFTDQPCISWSGGTGRVDHADINPLIGRDVIIWPDNDPAGITAASKLQKRLPRARLLRVDDLPESADAADVWPDDPAEWLASRLPPDPAPGLRELLSVEAWADRDIPEPDYLLGSIITTTSRCFIVGRTGLGKTMFGVAMGIGMAAGTGFLRWRSSRPARVLYVDGEMPAELIKARSVDALRRSGDRPPPPGNLVIYSRELEDEIKRRLPTIGTMEPLNTEAGHSFILALIDALGGVDVVIFDNVMSLVAGDQKDEISWSDTLPLVDRLSARRIGQVWLDHTGHTTDRQYGSSTKAWRFDTVGIMAPLPDDQRQPREVAFTLSFDAPGKARRRTPSNWDEFEPCTVRLRDDIWTVDASSETADRAKARPNEGKLRDKPAVLLRELRNLIAAHGSNEYPVVDGPLVMAIRRQVLRTALVSIGWFPETMLRTASDGSVELGRSGFPAENHALTTLKRNGFLSFTRDWAWLV